MKPEAKVVHRTPIIIKDTTFKKHLPQEKECPTDHSKQIKKNKKTKKGKKTKKTLTERYMHFPRILENH